MKYINNALLFFAVLIFSSSLYADDLDIYVDTAPSSNTGFGGGSIYDDGADASLMFILDNSGSMKFDVLCNSGCTRSDIPSPDRRLDVMKYAFMDFISAAANNTNVGLFRYSGEKVFDAQYLNTFTGEVSEYQLDWENNVPTSDTQYVYLDYIANENSPYDETYYRNNSPRRSSYHQGRVGNFRNANNYRNTFRFTLPSTIKSSDELIIGISSSTARNVSGVRLYFRQDNGSTLNPGEVYDDDSNVLVTNSLAFNNSGFAEIDISNLLASGAWSAGQRGHFIMARDGQAGQDITLAYNSTYIAYREVVENEKKDTLKIPVRTYGSDAMENSEGIVFDINNVASSSARDYTLNVASDYAGKRSVNPNFDEGKDENPDTNPRYLYSALGSPSLGVDVGEDVETYRAIFSINADAVSDVDGQLLQIDNLTIQTGLNKALDGIKLFFFQTDSTNLNNDSIKNYVFNDDAMFYLGDLSLNQFGNAEILASGTSLSENIKSLFSQKRWSPTAVGHFVLAKDDEEQTANFGFGGSFVDVERVGGGTNLNLKLGNKVGLRFISVPLMPSETLSTATLVVYPKSGVMPDNITISLADGSPSRLFKTTDSYLSKIAAEGPIKDKVTISLAGQNVQQNKPLKITSDAFTALIQKLIDHKDPQENINKQWFYEGGISLILEGDNNSNGFIYSFDEHNNYAAELHLKISNPDDYLSQQTHRGQIIEAMNDFLANGFTPISRTYYDAVLNLIGGNNFNNSPITKREGSGQCRISDSVVLLTDGSELSAQDPQSSYENAPFNIESSVCKEGPLDDQFWGCTNALAKRLTETGVEVNGYGYKTKINSYGIVFGNTFSVIPEVNKFAQYGGTDKAYQASSGAQLIEVFESIVSNIEVESASIAAPSVSINALNRFESSDELYYGLFKPEPHVGWTGNLKRYSLRDGKIVGADLLPATEAVQQGSRTVSEFSDRAISWWNTDQVPDGKTVGLGGAKQLLDSERKVYTYIKGDNSFGSEALFNNEITSSSYPLDPAYRLDENIVNYMKDGATRWGAAIHSSPVLVNYSTNKGEPINTLFAGDNAGFLHAINTGEPTNLNDSTYNLNNSGGNEVYSFVPKELLSNFADLKSKRPAGIKVNGHDKYVYGVDGKITVLKNDYNRDGDYIDADDNVSLYFGLRRGGKAYYGLNVKESFNRALVRFWSSPKDHVIIEPEREYAGTKTISGINGPVEEEVYIRADANDYPVANLIYKVESQKGSAFNDAQIEIFDEIGRSIKVCPFEDVTDEPQICEKTIQADDGIVSQLIDGAAYVVKKYRAVFTATSEGVSLVEELESQIGYYPDTAKGSLFELPCDDEDNLIRSVCIKEVYGKSSNPKVLFHKSKEDGGAWGRLGQTWSPMLPFIIMWNGSPRKVLIFGGGYDEIANETDNGKYKTLIDDTQMGNAVYIVDAVTGEIISVVSGVTLTANESYYHEDMKFSIPGSVAGRDSNFDTALDMLYVADLGGQIFRIDLNPRAGSGKSLVNNVYTIAKLGITSNELTGEQHHRRFFEGPSVAFLETGNRADDHMIAIGSGYRPDLRNNSVHDYMFVIYDKMARKKGLDSVPEKIIEVSDLENVTDKASASDGGSRGWYIKLEKSIGEKVTGTPLIFASRVAFVTYNNSVAGAGDTCAVDIGSSRSYFVNQDSSGVIEPDDVGDGDDGNDNDNGNGNGNGNGNAQDSRVIAEGLGLIDTGRIVVTTVDGEITVIKLDGSDPTCLGGNCDGIDGATCEENPNQDKCTCEINPKQDSCSCEKNPDQAKCDLLPDFGAIVRGNWRQCRGVDSSICGGDL